MQEKKKRNRILMLLIVGMLLIYAFTDIENVKINRERKIFFSSAKSKCPEAGGKLAASGTYICKRGAERHIDGKN